jgi:hypothetical protein
MLVASWFAQLGRDVSLVRESRIGASMIERNLRSSDKTWIRPQLA